MAITAPSDACPVPDLPHPVPAIERSGMDIVQNPPIVRVEDVQESIEDKRAIERFRKNLWVKCSDPSVLDNITVKTYRIDGNLERIRGVQLFIVSDKKTGKVLSYHEEDGRCVLELDKVLDDFYIRLDNAGGMGMEWQVRPENGVRIYWIVMKHIDGVKSAYPPWEYREGTFYFNRMAVSSFLLDIR